MAAMDLDKINMDLVESLLEWIVDGKHNYPPGMNHPHILPCSHCEETYNISIHK